MAIAGGLVAGGALGAIWLMLLRRDADALAAGRWGRGMALAVGRWALLVVGLLALVEVGGATALLAATVGLTILRVAAVPRLAEPT